MKLELPLDELKQYLKSSYNLEIDLHNIEENKIEIDYYVSLTLTVREVKDHEILFHYKVNGLLNMLAKGAHYFLEKKMEGIPIEWDASNNELLLDLTKVDALKDFLKILSISDLKFIDNQIVLSLKTRL